MALIGAVPWLKAILLIAAQLCGAMAAAGIVSATFPGPLSVRTSLGAGTSITRGLFIEMFLTAQLVFCIFMLAAEKHKSTFIAPIGIGLALFIAELAGKCIILPSHLQESDCRRCPVHRWISQPSPFVRSVCRPPKLSRLPLDLLGGTTSWLSSCRFTLPSPEGTRV